MTRRMRAQRRQDGASAVEFALLFTFILAPLLFGMLQYGMYFYATNAASSAAREALRKAQVGDCDNSNITPYVNDQTAGARDGDATASVAYTAAGTGSPVTDPEVGDTVTVQVSLKAIGLGGFIPQPNGGNIEREASGRLEDTEPNGASPCS